MNSKTLFQGLGFLTSLTVAGLALHQRGYQKGYTDELEICNQEMGQTANLVRTCTATGEACLSRLEDSVAKNFELEGLVEASQDLAEFRLEKIEECEEDTRRIGSLHEKIYDESEKLLAASETTVGLQEMLIVKKEETLASYEPCTFEQQRKIRQANEWIKDNGSRVEDFFAYVCTNLQLCTKSEAIERNKFFDGMILDLDQTQFFCPSKNQATSTGDDTSTLTLGLTLKDATPETPAQIALFPALFDEGFCQLAGTIVHEEAGHAYSGIRHEKGMSETQRDWIYVMGVATTTVCEHSSSSL